MIVHVKYVDIAARWDRNMCPVERAILRHTGIRTVVTSASIEGLRAYHTPRSVQRFVDAFDGGRKVKPFKFRLVRLDAKGRS